MRIVTNVDFSFHSRKKASSKKPVKDNEIGLDEKQGEGGRRMKAQEK